MGRNKRRLPGSKWPGSKKPPRHVWLAFLESNFLVAAALGLPTGVLIAFGRSAKLGVPYWPAAFLPAVLAGLVYFLNPTGARTKRVTYALDVLLASSLGASLCLLEAPWRDAYTAATFWTHALGMAIGGAITGALLSVVMFLLLKLERRGPYTKMVDAAPYILSPLNLLFGAAFGFILCPFSLLLWTDALLGLQPAFLPSAVFFPLLTAILFAPLGIVLSWLKYAPAGGSGSYQSADFGGGGESSTSSSFDDEE